MPGVGQPGSTAGTQRGRLSSAAAFTRPSRTGAGVGSSIRAGEGSDSRDCKIGIEAMAVPVGADAGSFTKLPLRRRHATLSGVDPPFIVEGR
jgi:hypothetical protein